jgi:glutamyl-tRNA reductase
MPVEVYLELKQTREQREREEARHQAAIEAKLEEFFNWAERHWAERVLNERE